MSTPANLFGIEHALTDRLAELQARIADLVVGSAITLVGETNPGQYMPGVFVRPGEGKDAADVGGMVQETQHWIVICGVKAIADKRRLTTTYTDLGQLAHRVLQWLHNWPSPEGLLMYGGRDEVMEQPGYAYVALHFHCKSLLETVDDSALDDFLQFDATYAVADADSTSEDRVDLPAAEAIE